LLGKVESKPAESCVDIMFNGDKKYESGIYYLKKGSKTFKVYCDEETDRGGWTLFYAYGHNPYEHYVVNETEVFPKHPEYGRSHVVLEDFGIEASDIAEVRF